MVRAAIKKAEVLVEALPYIKKFREKIFIIKYGGSILGEEKVRKSVIEDIVFLRYMGIKPILIHGGGPNINEKLKQLNIPVKFINGIRVTDEPTMKVVQEELESLNDVLVNEINEHGELAKSFKKEDKLLKVVPCRDIEDIGFVGELIGFDEEKLKAALKKAIPVIIPVGVSQEGVFYNINADDVAFFLASRLKVEKLILLTKVLGVMRNVSDEDSLFSTITSQQAESLIKDKVISDGMVPKIRAAVNVIQAGVKKAHIVDAKIPHAILLEIFTDRGIGTEIIK